MYIQINTVKVDLNHKDEFVAIAGSDKLKELLPGAKGYQGAYLLQSVVDPEEFVSVTLWDSAEEAQAFLGGPDYGSVLVGVRDFLLSNLDRRGYQVLVDYSA